MSSNDPGQDTISNWAIDWGDGSAIENFAGSTTSVQHTYADGGNPETDYTVLVSATDEDGTFAADPFVVSVVNVDPTADAGGPYLTFDDTSITLTGSGADAAGVLDPLSF